MTRIGWIAAATLLAPQVAGAGTVVLTPLVADDTVNPKQRLGVHQLIASELDFSPEVQGVVELDAVPPNLDDMCMTNPRCLGGIASANGGDQLITGRMSGAGGNYLLDLVFFDGSQIARRKQFTVSQDPTALANGMTPVVREVLTGQSDSNGAAPGLAPVATADDFDMDDELDLGGGGDSARRLAAVGAVSGMGGMATQPPPAPVPVPMPAPPPAPAPAASDADIAGMISFGGTVDDISAQEIDQMIQFGAPPGVGAAAPPPAPVPVPQPMVAMPVPVPQPAIPAGMADPDLAAEAAEMAQLDGGLVDLDSEQKGRQKTPRASGSTSSTGTVSGELEHKVQVTGRGGYCKYYKFDFITGGAEAAVRLSDGVHLLAGMEVYAVNRVLPPELQFETGLYSEWNTIFPMNLGLMYKFAFGMVQPYVGADAIFVQYYKDEIGADWAGGARARAGLDLMFVKNFGINVNVAAGGWSGKNWGLIEQGVGSAGFLPQVSGGTVLAF